MDISIALNIIKKSLKKEVIESRHFKDQCKARNLDITNIKEIITKKQILGILDQEENLYKVWFPYEKNKDLNIITKILPNKKLKFITVFPSDSERRTKK